MPASAEMPCEVLDDLKPPTLRYGFEVTLHAECLLLSNGVALHLYGLLQKRYLRDILKWTRGLQLSCF